MKITIEEKQKPLNRIYPYLGENRNLGLLVAFTSPSKGVVIKGGEFHKVGDKDSTWNELSFEPIESHPQPKPIPVEERKYPYVGVADNGLKVYFTTKRSGVVIEPGRSTYSYFATSKIWDENAFTPIQVSKITIELD